MRQSTLKDRVNTWRTWKPGSQEKGCEHAVKGQKDFGDRNSTQTGTISCNNQQIHTDWSGQLNPLFHLRIIDYTFGEGGLLNIANSYLLSS